jgi:hypothetical protein
MEKHTEKNSENCSLNSTPPSVDVKNELRNTSTASVYPYSFYREKNTFYRGKKKWKTAVDSNSLIIG